MCAAAELRLRIDEKQVGQWAPMCEHEKPDHIAQEPQHSCGQCQERDETSPPKDQSSQAESDPDEDIENGHVTQLSAWASATADSSAFAMKPRALVTANCRRYERESRLEINTMAGAAGAAASKSAT
jgi:hypothetical protein